MIVINQQTKIYFDFHIKWQLHFHTIQRVSYQQALCHHAIPRMAYTPLLTISIQSLISTNLELLLHFPMSAYRFCQLLEFLKAVN